MPFVIPEKVDSRISYKKKRKPSLSLSDHPSCRPSLSAQPIDRFYLRFNNVVRPPRSIFRSKSRPSPPNEVCQEERAAMRKAARENANDDARVTYVPGMQHDMGGGNHVDEKCMQHFLNSLREAKLLE